MKNHASSYFHFYLKQEFQYLYNVHHLFIFKKTLYQKNNKKFISVENFAVDFSFTISGLKEIFSLREGNSF